jgi:Bacterial extracellular solute-binding protein, family 7
MHHLTAVRVLARSPAAPWTEAAFRGKPSRDPWFQGGRKMRVRTWVGGIAGAVLLAATAGAQDKVEIRFGTTNPPGGMQYLSGEEWVKRVNEKAGDLVQADIYGSSQLGDDTEMLQKVRLGALEVSQPSTIMSTVLPEFGLFDMPYLVKDRAHMDCIAEEIVWPLFAPKLEEKGYKLVGVWENGFRQITNYVRPINTPEDLKDSSSGRHPAYGGSRCSRRKARTRRRWSSPSCSWRCRPAWSTARRTRTPTSGRRSSRRCRNT